MIDKKSRRVVIINNIQSDTIDQAIFILKSDKTDPKAFAANTSTAWEAQSIIDNYIRQVERLKSEAPDRKKRRKKNRSGIAFWLGITTAAIVLISLISITNGI